MSKTPRRGRRKVFFAGSKCSERSQASILQIWTNSICPRQRTEKSRLVLSSSVARVSCENFYKDSADKRRRGRIGKRKTGWGVVRRNDLTSKVRVSIRPGCQETRVASTTTAAAAATAAPAAAATATATATTAQQPASVRVSANSFTAV